MDDKIDIEEHDIMENPSIRNMFPDLSQIKEEIYRNCEKAVEPALNTYYEKTTNPANSLDDTIAPQNKLIQCNKIILGSKPKRIVIDENYFESCVKPYQANVVLQDIKSYLRMSKRYCETCEILFPEPSNYEDHIHLYHPKTYTTDSLQSKSVVKITYKHKCNECAKMFASSSMLKEHMETSHNLSLIPQKQTAIENDNRIVNQKETENNNNENRKSIQDNNSELSNTCYHCKETFETQKCLIEHLYDILKTKKRTETEIIPVLKSVLFRCNKCDIHFVSSQIAENHQDHMEMLINWKCCICYRIFKKEDELSHERQHSVSNNFVIYNLSDLHLNKILFKCSKCSGHFAESKYLYHFRDCGLKTNKLPFCTICNIFIDSSLKVSHESEHKTTDLNVNQFTVIETEVISDNPVKPAAKGYHIKNKINNILETIREVKVVLQRLETDNLFPQPGSGTERNSQLDISLESKKTEPLISSKSDKVSFENNKNEKYNMKKKKSRLMQTEQKSHDGELSHDKNKLDDIGHTNILTSKIESLIDLKKLDQAYLYCEDCKCYMPKQGRMKHMQSICTNLKKTPCIYCGLMLTVTSYRTHKKLHEKRSDLRLNNFIFFNLYSGKRITPPIPEYPDCPKCGVHFLNKTDRINHVCSEEAYLTCDFCKMKLSEAAFKLHMMFHTYSMEHNSKIKKRNAVSSSSVQSNVDLHNTSTEIRCVENGIKLQNQTQNTCDSSPKSQTLNDSEIIYTCRNCDVTVDTYDKVVEHCHGHYDVKEKTVETEDCKICSLKIDSTCYPEHQNVHKKKGIFQILKFDSYYFPVDNGMWVKHVFKSMPREKVLEILGKSIYRFEGRIKMVVTQQGSHELTVYKCDQCRCFIEPTTLFKHADNSCFKLRNHPCTTCGLPFISSASRIDHEKIHKRPGITLTSYRIVVFNREQDKLLNSSICFRKRYLLYQCRNCDGIIDKLQSDVHQCNFSDLNKCPDCNLLLNTKVFEAHAAEHKEFASFNYRNMKVILLGEVKSTDDIRKNTLKSNYQGIIFDYKMYRCNKCQICIKNEKLIPKHSCYFGKPHSKCPKCDLYFSVSRLKTHLRAHERDPDFLRANMTIISFDPDAWDQNNDATTLAGTSDKELTDSNDDSDCDIVFEAEEKCNNYNGESPFDTNEVVEETAKVYKCACGLHFLNEDSIFRHFGVCRSNGKISKQKCPKCDLLFTSNILFTHLLAHHSNKSRRYKYDIVEKKK